MKEIIDWYWEYGYKRGQDQSDPDRELRKISIGGWLDPVVQILERNKDIQANASGKACLALWGPSQTGKSTMMSRYVDGESIDGADSALTWSLEHKVRFSPPQDGVDTLRVISPNTLVFNPFNHQSDASGVVTRYTLKSADDNSVNPNFPIEIKFTSRTQIVQSMSLGYLSECEPIDETVFYTQDSFLENLPEGGAGEASAQNYLLLKDIANVIEFMRGSQRFNNLFKRGEWSKKIRKALVSSPLLLSDAQTLKKFMTQIFWDSAEKLTRTYDQTVSLLDSLANEWNGCRILASMEVGSLLLDIDSFRSFTSPDGNQGREIKDKISRLTYERVGSEIHIMLGDVGSPNISGNKFGSFQAICAEIIVPLKKENLETSAEKKSFLRLVEKCDFLDFPGVSNKNNGNNVDDNVALIDVKIASEVDIFSKIFKQGKTQCFVYNYVRRYGIDAFAMLMRTDRYPSQASLLNAGIKEWVCSFEPDWSVGRPTRMPIFVNMTFFASLINSVAMNGTGNGLAPYLERIGQLMFARKESARFFVTTYHQFPDGKITATNSNDTTINAIISDPNFAPTTGLTEENILAVYSEDGGLDYMFDNIHNEINTFRRKDCCRNILNKDKGELMRLILAHLPSGDDSNADARKAKINECCEHIENLIDSIEEDDCDAGYKELAEVIKDLYFVPQEAFDPLPQNARDMSKKEIKKFINAQVMKWYDYKVANIEANNFLSTEEIQTILIALRDSVNQDALFSLITSRFGNLSDRIMATAARYPFSLAVGNQLRTASIFCESDVAVGDNDPVLLSDFITASIERDTQKEVSPYYVAVLKPFIMRLKQLAETSVSGNRPPQEGDIDLKAIFDKIETSSNFEIM